MSACFGIHLGNSSVCLVLNNDGKSDVVANDLGDRVTPAVLALNENEWEIGASAKSGQSRNKPTITNNKRLLNNDLTDAETETFVAASDCKIISYDSVIKYEFQLPSKIVTFTPDDIASKLFGKMFSIASHSVLTDGELQAVLAAPLHWSQSSRQRMMTAAELAGFTVLQVVSEPAAALLAYGVGQGPSSPAGEEPQPGEDYVLVYRLGGTSCDAAVVRVAGGMYSIEGSVHNADIGGKCLTRELSDYIASEFYQKWKLNPQENRRAMSKLFHHADNCKHVLSTLSSSHVFIESLYEGVDWSQNVTRARFDNLITPKLSAYMSPIQSLLKDEFLKSKINKIILCGGSMKIPKLQSAVAALLPQAEVLTGYSPDEVVAQGCSKQAALLLGLPELNLKSVHVEIDCISSPIYAKYRDTSVCLFPAGSPLYSEVTVPIQLLPENKDTFNVSLYEQDETNILGKYSFANVGNKTNMHVTLNDRNVTVNVV